MEKGVGTYWNLLFWGLGCPMYPHPPPCPMPATVQKSVVPPGGGRWTSPETGPGGYLLGVTSPLGGKGAFLSKARGFRVIPAIGEGVVVLDLRSGAIAMVSQAFRGAGGKTLSMGKGAKLLG